MDYKASFEHFDTDYSGEIDVQEFQEGLQSLGIEVGKAKRDLMKRLGDAKAYRPLVLALRCSAE